MTDTEVLHTVNTQHNDETSEEEKPWSEEVQKTKVISVLDDLEETRKGRQKELNPLKEMGAMTVVKKSEAVCKRAIQTRWVDRAKDGRLKSRLILQEYNRCQGRYSARDVLTNTIGTVSENNVGCKFTRSKQPSTSQLQSTYTQRSCTLMLIKSCLQSHQNLTKGMNQSCAMTKCGN